MYEFKVREFLKVGERAVPPSKGKDFTKLPKRFNICDTEMVHTSIKYDGHYNQLHLFKREGELTTMMFTSGGLPWLLPKRVEEVVIQNLTEGVYECEFTNGDGKLGGLFKCGNITTRRTAYGKGDRVALPFEKNERLRIFAKLPVFDDNEYQEVEDFTKSTSPHLMKVVKLKMQYAVAVKWAETLMNKGFEGGIIELAGLVFRSNRRTNFKIKQKATNVVEMICTGIKEGKGKYSGMIGSLELASEGLSVSVGSGLTDTNREMEASYFIGRKVSVGYYTMSAGTLTQPRVKKVL